MYDYSRDHDSPPLPPVYYAQHDPTGTAKLSTTVVHALAESTGVDVTDSTETLYDHVDPDGLDALFSPRYDGAPRTGGTLSFRIYDHRVIVHSDGRIIIEPPTAPKSR